MKLKDRAVLMRLSLGMPGESRGDGALSAQVKQEHALGEESGGWSKKLFPKAALEPIKKIDNEARAYHELVTLPFDAGIGILPSGLIWDYSEKMKEFQGRRQALIESHFLAKYDTWIEWAKLNHNGTFDAELYPGVEAEREKFYFRNEPIPVPDSEHFSSTVASLLGTDTASVDLRVKDATVEGQKELMRRIMAPVEAMAKKLAEVPKEGKDSPIFRDSLIGNVREIAELAPKLNLTGDPEIDRFAAEVEKLARYAPDSLRKDGSMRAEAAGKAAEVLTRLSAYKL